MVKRVIVLREFSNNLLTNNNNMSRLLKEWGSVNQKSVCVTLTQLMRERARVCESPPSSLS